jgi:SAM-dependent methyltransferase
VVARLRMARLADGFLTTQPLYVAARLGVADVLAEGSRTGPEIAAAVGADPDLLTRALRGHRFFDHLRRHPEQEAAFQASMADRSEQEAGDVVAAYDFGGIGRLVDVGGGHGILLGAILRSAPDLDAVLVDQPAVVEQAARRLTAEGVADRCQLVGGDFFAGVPAGADAYLLSRVLHDWTDDDARRVLATCHTAMGPGSRLLVVEAILPDRAADQPAVIRMDLYMLVLLGARERTESQFRRLLGDAGLEVRRVVPTRSPAGLSVIEAVPAA